MRRYLLLTSFLSFPAIACGSGPTVDPLDVDLAGSYELTAGAITQTPGTFPGPQPSQNPSPSKDKRFRLDLRRSGATYEAVITPEWGNPSAMTVSVQSGSLVLGGEVNVSGSNQYGVSDRWETFVVPVTKNGLEGSITMTGDEMVSQGDVAWNYKLSGNATVARDQRIPEFRLIGSGSAGGKYLPWDRIYVDVSEPVDALKLKAGVQGRVATTNTVFTATEASGGAAWAGSVELQGSWDAFDVPGGPGRIEIQPGIPDLVGNSAAPSMAPQSFDITMAELGPPRIALDFDGKDNLAPALWGNAAIVTGADCEGGGGCATFGVVQQSYCSFAKDGLAARLTGAGAKTLAFRYRVHVAPKYGGSESMFTNASLLKVDLARTGAAATNTEVKMPKLTMSGPPEQQVFDSAWMDGSVVIPSGGENLAFAIRPTALYGYGCGGPAPAPADVTVWIDSIRME